MRWINATSLKKRFGMGLMIGIVIIGLTLAASAQSHPPGFTKLEIGDSVPDFDLPGVDDQNHKLSEYDSAKVLMVVFTCNHCPTAQAYEERLNQIYDDYYARGVAVVAISPNDPKAVRLDELGYSDLGDTLEDMKVRAKLANFKFPYLYDGETQKTSLAFGVLATPHVFIFDADRKLRYKGRIDDAESGEVKSPDARNAIDAILANKDVPVEVTKVFGCSTKWFTKRDSSRKAIAKWDKEPVSLSQIGVEELKAIAANESEKYRLVNVWATWCVPCVEELPDLVTINRMYRGRKFEMVTVSADELESKDSAHAMLSKLNVSSKNVIFGAENQDDLFEGLDSKWEGGLPYTMLIAPGGKVVYRKHGAIDPFELKQIIADRVGRTFESDKVKPIVQSLAAGQSLPAIEVGDNFKSENLIAWCYVAFDAVERTPETRAKMISELGLKRASYAWREKNIPEFEDEIKCYKAKGIEYFSFYNWHESIEGLIKKHEITPQIWEQVNGTPKGETDEERVANKAASLKTLVDKTREMGLKLAIYNHGGWCGEPDNMIAIVEKIRETQPNSEHVGIVYNFHHGHDDLENFSDKMKRMKSFLHCLNLNGMADPEMVDRKTHENKIIPIGSGVHEHAMIQAVVDSGYSGPIGVLNHLSDVDAQVAIKANIDGLEKLVAGEGSVGKVNPPKK